MMRRGSRARGSGVATPCAQVAHGPDTEQVVPVAARSAARHALFPSITRERVLALLLSSPSLIATAVSVYGFIAWTGALND